MPQTDQKMKQKMDVAVQYRTVLHVQQSSIFGQQNLNLEEKTKVLILKFLKFVFDPASL